MAAELEGARFLLETGASHRLLEYVDARTLDIVVTAEMGPPGEGMTVLPLLEEPFVAAIPKGHADAIADLAADPVHDTASHGPPDRRASRGARG